MTRLDRIHLSYTLTFTTPFHFGTGLRVGLVDRTIVRDHDGYLYLPGSTIKGVLREQCEQLARLYEVLDDEMRESITNPHDEKSALWAQGLPLTMVTRIFGSHSYPGRLFFDDARQSEKDIREYNIKEPGSSKEASDKRMEIYKSLQTDRYTQVQLDRLTRTSARGALYTSEFGIKDITFEGCISGWLECNAIESIKDTITEDSPTYSLLLLLAGLHLLTRIGGNKSTGRGQCKIEDVKLTYRNNTYSKEQWQSWFDHLDELSYYSSIVQEEPLV